MSPNPAGSAARAPVPVPGGQAAADRTADARRILGRFAVCALIVGLAVFHGQLLWQRIADLTVLEPLVALRWGAAVLVLAGFVQLHRAGISLVWGRRALILWLLALLLHAGSVASLDGQLVAEPVLLLALPLWGFALRVVLGERAGPGGGGGPRLEPLFPVLREAPAGLPCEPGSLEPLSPRPPPARSTL